jgi:hypothetical protein
MDLKGLLELQQQLMQWLEIVNQKIRDIIRKESK